MKGEKILFPVEVQEKQRPHPIEKGTHVCWNPELSDCVMPVSAFYQGPASSERQHLNSRQ